MIFYIYIFQMGVSKLRGVVESFKIHSSVLGDSCLKIKNVDRIVLDMSVIIWTYVKPDLDSTTLLYKLSELKCLYGDVVCVFDGCPPVQKLKEQIQRRVANDVKNKKYGSVTPTFDFFDLEYSTFLQDLEHKLSETGFRCVSKDIPGEADHKIFEFILEKNNVLVPTVIVSNDWDIFVRSVCVSTMIDSKILYSCPAGTYDPRRVPEPVEWIQSVMILGCDYYPGIGNFKLFKNLFERLDNTEVWLKNEKGMITVDRKRLSKWLKKNKQNFYSSVDYASKYFVKMLPESEMNEENYETHFATEQSCSGSCLFCRESGKYPLHSLDLYEAWLEILTWTLNHYMMKPPMVPVVYPYGYGPDISGMIKYLRYNRERTGINYTSDQKAYVTKKLWETVRAVDDRVIYDYCPRRPVYYKSQLSIDFFYS